MTDPLRDFDWSSLYERYDAMCRRFNPAAVHMKIITPKPQSDRELYYHLVERIRMTDERPSGLSIDLYEALLYWKLYSNPLALANVQHWLDSGTRVAQSANLKRLLDGLPRQIDRDKESVVHLVKRLGEYKVVGMKNASALPVRTTFLHYLFPAVVPIFDTMALKAVGVDEPNANQRVDVLREYLRFFWELTDQHAAHLPGHSRETSVRLIDMALWVVRGEGSGGKPRT